MHIEIPGPAGQLEAVIHQGATDSGRYAVLAHPHPRFGGSLHDAVLATAESVLLAAGVHCLKFNFRGVGASEGAHDGNAEADDVAAVVAWLRAERHPEQLTLGGYSFGAAMTWAALELIAQPDLVVLMAPPSRVMPLAKRNITCPVHVIAGDADEYVDVDAFATWPGTRVHTIVGADHFFTGRQEPLRESLATFL